ncbi:CHAT domain-containing protein [Streptomyces rimosus]|uniref:CHAT domain-containing protein n=1 Tax=Streptomyces rimosus TaxID=1927 RepID=UPI003CCFFFF3
MRRLERSELACLFACRTAVTKCDPADESLHVVTAFQPAGFPRVVETLWQGDDTLVGEIAEHIYAQLAADGFGLARAGIPVHGAVRQFRDRYPKCQTL